MHVVHTMARRTRVILILSLFLVIASMTAIMTSRNARDASPKEHIPSDLPQTTDMVSDEHGIYTYATIKVSDPSSVSLIPNFSPQKLSQEIRTEHNCRSAINGGFYDENNAPLGLFITENNTVGTLRKSSLLNEFFWVDGDGSFGITRSIPEKPLRIALQSGPLLIENGVPARLSIQDDKPARRMVVGITESGEIVFLTIYTKDSVYQGPLLTTLPNIVMETGQAIGVRFIAAMNLDGGSASAFYGSETSLSELTPIGSLFCIK